MALIILAAGMSLCLANHRVTVGANCHFAAEPLLDIMTAQMATRLMLRSFKRENRKVSIIDEATHTLLLLAYLCACFYHCKGIRTSLVFGSMCYVGGKENSLSNKPTWSLTPRDPCKCTGLKIADLVIRDIMMVRHYLQIRCGMFINNKYYDPIFSPRFVSRRGDWFSFAFFFR